MRLQDTKSNKGSGYLIKLIFIFCMINGLTVSAQQVKVNEPDYNKPSLFVNLPASIAIPVSVLNDLTTRPAGHEVDILLDDAFQLQGIVMSATVKNNNKLFTVSIKSVNRPGSFITLSKINREDGAVLFSGRMLSFHHSDCFILIKNERDDNYRFVKKDFYKLVNE